ncbi:MAG: MobA/MobL family protein [Eubacteriales bacterium]
MRGVDFIGRNSFIQMSKLSNVKGRIDYIASPKRQENLYATYQQTEMVFWKNLAKCNQEEFASSGTKGTCIEARELIIALPESLAQYEPENLLNKFTEAFGMKYGVSCVSALHHNKRKTNYHIHLIFSERKLLDDPVEKIATRNMFYNEQGKKVRTKKEILDADGNLRRGCKVIPKGEVYERKIFTKKEEVFKSKAFLDEAKIFYTEMINTFVLNEDEILKVYDKDSPYLATKKIGKNNPKAEEIKVDNEIRQKWNEEVDRAYIAGVTDTELKVIRTEHIAIPTKKSIEEVGAAPYRLYGILERAIAVLKAKIHEVMRKLLEDSKSNDLSRQDIVVEEGVLKEPTVPALVKKLPYLQKLEKQFNQLNVKIVILERDLDEYILSHPEINNIFKGKERKEREEKIADYGRQIAYVKKAFVAVRNKAGYKDIKAFQNELQMAQHVYRAYAKEKQSYETEVYKREHYKNQIEVVRDKEVVAPSKSIRRTQEER